MSTQQLQQDNQPGLEIDIPGVRVEEKVDPAKQYGRKFSLIIGPDSGEALDLSEFRCVFMVERGDLQTPNSCRVRVYNVARETAYRAMKEFKRLVLQAGYQGNFGIIFDGTIVQTRFGRENATDTYMDITAADGDSAYNFAIVSATISAGSRASDQINVIAKAMEKHGVSLGFVSPLDDKPLARGKVLVGMGRDYMRQIARTTESAWSIQDGKLEMVREISYKPGDVIAINSATGMVGYPVQTQNGVTVRMLLNPYIKISQLVQIDNRNNAIQEFEYSLAVDQQAEALLASAQNALDPDGFYYVMIARHWGDTRGNDWYTEAICLGADAIVAKEFIERAVAPTADVVVVKRYP